MIDQIKRLMGPIQRRVMNMLARAVIESSDESGSLQKLKVQVYAGEFLEGIERVQNYGFISRPLTGAEALVVFLNGSRDHGVVVATDDRRYRLKTLVEGEVALYTDEGDQIIFKRGNKIQITSEGELDVSAPTVKVAATTKITLTTPLVEMSQDLIVDGDLTVTGASDLIGEVTATAIAASGAVAAASLASTSGGIADVGSKVSEIRTAFNSHHHVQSATTGGTTSIPDQTVS